MRNQFIVASLIVTIIISAAGYFFSTYFYWAFVFLGPIIILGWIDVFDTKHTIVKNYPIFGRFRYVMEELRPKIYQYFIESDTDGTPISRIFRSVVYQRAKKETSSSPFGTQLNVYEPGYEWINHSMYPLPLKQIKVDDMRIKVGGSDCKQPYSLSIFNVSAMSFGSLSYTAVESLNWGAKEGNFAHNTGEGAISPYHLKHGGDLVWQIGTGYFGCRTLEGNFDPDKFSEKAHLPNVKMIEIKLSQGAKPGHGGILPSAKNTKEIAAIRGVKPGTTVESPGKHSAFSDAEGLLRFVAQLRELSGGKPVGFKLCLGIPAHFEEIVDAMISTGLKPDFITVDGSEGGTGAAPLEFANSIGMSLRDGIIFVHDTLCRHGLKEDIKIIASGKIITGFDIIKILALGADACNSARGMMLALGCIQALVCNLNKCPTGVATQNKQLAEGLNINVKYKRVANYHNQTLESVGEILSAAGLESVNHLKRHHIWRRITYNKIKNYEQLFPYDKTLTDRIAG